MINLGGWSEVSPLNQTKLSVATAARSPRTASNLQTAAHTLLRSDRTSPPAVALEGVWEVSLSVKAFAAAFSYYDSTVFLPGFNLNKERVESRNKHLHSRALCTPKLSQSLKVLAKLFLLNNITCSVDCSCNVLELRDNSSVTKMFQRDSNFNFTTPLNSG